MAQKKTRQVLVCRRGFTAAVKGGRPRVVKGGQLVAADDPVVKGREHLFAPVEDVVEQATAAPGELRAVKPRQQPDDDPGGGDGDGPDDGGDD